MGQVVDDVPVLDGGLLEAELEESYLLHRVREGVSWHSSDESMWSFVVLPDLEGVVEPQHHK